MVELRLSPFKPGRDISTSSTQLYHLYNDGKIVDRTFYTIYRHFGENFKGILVLNKRTIEEIKPSILNACREHNKNYPKYWLSENIVVVSGITGKIIFDTKDKYCIDNPPKVISNYMFIYKNNLYNNKGELIKSFENISNSYVLNDVYVVIEGYGYRCYKCYVFDKFGKLINEYK